MKSQAVMLGSKTAVTIKNEKVQVYPHFFKSPVLPRQANKTLLADAMWEIVKDSQPESFPKSGVNFVEDGCALEEKALRNFVKCMLIMFPRNMASSPDKQSSV